LEDLADLAHGQPFDVFPLQHIAIAGRQVVENHLHHPRGLASLQHIAGTRPFGPAQNLACDVTGDGSCSTLDATMILQLKASIITRLPAAGIDLGLVVPAAARTGAVPDADPTAVERWHDVPDGRDRLRALVGSATGRPCRRAARRRDRQLDAVALSRGRAARRGARAHVRPRAADGTRRIDGLRAHALERAADRDRLEAERLADDDEAGESARGCC
jgi:hypothetical protein